MGPSFKGEKKDGEILCKERNTTNYCCDFNFFFSFAVIYAAPGDISGMYLNEQMSDEEKEAIRENLGLNKSLPEQYLGWAREVLKGDFGISLANNTSVTEQIVKRLPATLQLMGAALILSLLLAIPLGLWSGYRKNTWIDNIISGISYIGMSIPSFWLGMVLIIVFAAKLHILPSSGMHSVGNKSFLDTVKHMIMPCITLSLSNLAVFIRYIRSNTIGQLGEEYVLAAKAKGTTGGRLLKKTYFKKYVTPNYYFAGYESGIYCLWFFHY